MLEDTQEKRDTANSNLHIVVAGSRCYVVDGTDVLFCTTLSGTPSFTSVTGLPDVGFNGLASDGFNVYIACDDDGIYTTNTGISTASSFVTGTVGGFIAYVKNRLLCSEGPNLYNVTAGGALPTALLEHDNTGFDWIGAAGGLQHIFIAGVAGDKSLIYRTAVKADGTALDVPSVAMELPDGEVIYSIAGYLGQYILLGTSAGARFCTCDTDGNLAVGAPIRTASPVRCFEPQDRYVWFGWTNYDSVSTGLGRMDLSQFTESIETGARVPAYATDIMATTQGNVLDCVTFDERLFFAVDGQGFYSNHDTDKVTEGSLTTGLIAYGLPDQKIAMFCDVRTLPLLGSYFVTLTVDGGAEEEHLGGEDNVGDTGTEFPCDQTAGERFELEFTLEGDGSSGPTVTRYTLKASPGASDGPAEYIIVPAKLHDTLRIGNKEHTIDVGAIRDRIKSLRQRHVPVTYQEATSSYTVIVDAYEWIPYDFTMSADGGFDTPNGTMLIQLKRVFS